MPLNARGGGRRNGGIGSRCYQDGMVEVEASSVADQTDDQAVWLTATQAAQLLGVAAATVANWVDAGKLAGTRTAGGDRRRGSVRVRLSDVRRKAAALGRPLSLSATDLAALTPRAVPPGGVHGTRTSYNRGCRCEPCVEANRAYMRAWQQEDRPGVSRGKGKGKTPTRDGQPQSRTQSQAGYAKATTLGELLREW